MAAPMIIRRAFFEHPASVEESYLEHARVASHFGRTLAKASVKAFVHAIVPGMCATSASDTIKSLHAELMTGARGRIHGATEPTDLVGPASDRDVAA